jgi:hypothetical protein
MAVQDANATQGKSFMRTVGPMSEQEVREQLQKWHISESDIDAAFNEARQARTLVTPVLFLLNHTQRSMMSLGVRLDPPNLESSVNSCNISMLMG